MNRWHAIADFLALKRNTSLLLAALVLALSGERLWLGFAPKYLETLGAGVFIIGLFDALQTLLGAVYAYPGGWLTDRWGQRRSLMFFNALSLAGYVVVLLWQHWLALLAGAFLFLAWSALSLPATFTVVATSLEARQHTMGIGIQSLVRRIPMMLGPLAGGWLITHYEWQHGVRFALMGCIALTAATGVFQWFMVESQQGHHSTSTGITSAPPAGPAPSPGGGAGPSAPRPAAAAGFRTVLRSFSPALRELLVSDILIRFCERIPYAFVILWAMNHGGVSAQDFGVLAAIEMMTAMLCYIPVAHWADKHGPRPFVLATFGFFTLFPVSLLFAHSFVWLAFAFCVRGLKEFGEPARKAMIVALSAPEMRGRVVGAYYLVRDTAVTTGSFLGAWLWSVAPEANFIGAAAFGAAGTLFYALKFSPLHRPLVRDKNVC